MHRPGRDPQGSSARANSLACQSFFTEDNEGNEVGRPDTKSFVLCVSFCSRILSRQLSCILAHRPLLFFWLPSSCLRALAVQYWTTQRSRQGAKKFRRRFDSGRRNNKTTVGRSARASVLDCGLPAPRLRQAGGKRSATPLWMTRPWHARARRFHNRRQPIQSAVAAALCRRTPKITFVAYPADSPVINRGLRTCPRLSRAAQLFQSLCSVPRFLAVARSG